MLLFFAAKLCTYRARDQSNVSTNILFTLTSNEYEVRMHMRFSPLIFNGTNAFETF